MVDPAPKKLVWWESSDRPPRVITRNSDGGTTGWTKQDAEELYVSLGEILGARRPTHSAPE